ncbi:hypothetical protein BCR44DRAFT_1216412 [Catenaria anguillulae PL171]|uniref:Peptidase M14 domain-containing protein n=1 Tax=Catenaria anguillulae PL171 TaxID=765915 RepID=A0A1Y2HYX9_9FUNG|nr:hypothetical protein BCR44DRAFT_1216412 [Catenaria anguillulae PL171]
MKVAHRFLLSLVLGAILAATSVSAQDYVYSLPGELSIPDELVATFKGHRVIRIKNPTKSLLAAVGTEGLDVWSRGPNSIDIRVADQADEDKVRSAAGGSIQYDVVVDDVQTILDADRATRNPAFSARAVATASRAATNAVRRVASASRAAVGGGNRKPSFESVSDATVPLDLSWFADYHTYPQIVEFLVSKCTQFHQVCEFTPSIGRTVEGRDIVALKLGAPGTNKPQVYVEALLHAREWAGTVTAQYLIYQLLEQSESNEEIKQMLKTVDIHIVPLVNVDGYVWAQAGNRLWRKNRRRNRDDSFGVDLNRNFPFRWGTGGSSTIPRADTYRGRSAASEPEVQAVQRYYATLTRAVAGLDIHTFSQLILRPWGDIEADSPHEAQYKALGDQMREIIKGVHGKEYTSIKSIELYPTSGTASDFFYSETKVDTAGKPIKPVGYTFELRPDSQSGGGFILPKEQLLPLGQEILPAFLHYVKRSVEDPLR